MNRQAVAVTGAEVIAIERSGRETVTLAVRRGDGITRYTFTGEQTSSLYIVQFDNRFHADFRQPEDIDDRVAIAGIVRRVLRGEEPDLPISAA